LSNLGRSSVVRGIEWFRALALALAMLTGVAACGPTSAPFDRPAPGSNTLLLPPASGTPESAEFVVALPVGPAPETADKMATALTLALAHHGIAATTRPAAGLKRITASVRTSDVGEDIAIDITWRVLEAGGKEIGGNEHRAVARPQAWAEGEDRLISRISSQAAFRIARLLGRGDIANVPLSALPDALPGIPPASGPDAASPGAGPPADPDAPSSGPGAPSAIPGGPLPTQPPALAAASKAPRVLVATVTAPSPAGSRALTSAMRRALGESQMVLVNSKEPGAFEVQGSVELSPPVDGRQRIVVRWFVKRADGTQIGDLEQANTVPAGSLEGNWDKLAPIVALAAVDAVVELIARDRGG
jgi:hypothetical protein